MSKTSPSVEPATQPREPELLAGKVAIVTGASRGIGAAAARVFADAGAAVVLAARSQPEIDAIAQHIRSDGGEAVAVATDVTDPIAVQQMVHRAVVAYGRLDAAFNNAGQGHMPVPLAELALDDFDRALAVNARGTFLSMKYEIAAIDRTGGGAIVNMSSSAGLSGAPGMAAYSAAKHGVIGLTKVAALDYGAEGIRVNAVAPGPILTEGGIGAAPAEVQQRVAHLLPLKRLGTPLEVAHAVAWLLSDASSFVNGTTISIDGGKLAGMAGG